MRTVPGPTDHVVVVGAGLSATGYPLLANDTHLLLSNPPVFYLQHLKVTTAVRTDSVMGVQFAGLPGVFQGGPALLLRRSPYTSPVLRENGVGCRMLPFHGVPVDILPAPGEHHTPVLALQFETCRLGLTWFRRQSPAPGCRPVKTG
mgnify:CR=1 FL=1